VIGGLHQRCYGHAMTTCTQNLSAAEAACINRIADQGDVLVTRAIDWCAINSGSRNIAGLNTMLGVLEAAFAGLPGTLERLDLPPSESINTSGDVVAFQPPQALRLIVRPQAATQVVLTGHYDTVYPADSTFQRVVRRADGSLHGPGIADMKGGISVMLAALEAFEAHPDASRVGYTVLLSPDEEIGSLSSRFTLAKIGAKAHVGLTYEPALMGGVLASERKGSGNFAVIIRGRAAHAGRAFHEGRNALTAAARLCVALDALNGQRDGFTLNVGRIDGGGPLNVVPDLAIVRYDVRLADPADAAWADAAFAKAMADISVDGIHAHIHGGFTRPAKPFNTAQQTLFGYVKTAGADLGLDVQWAPSGGVCEGNNLFASGCPNIDSLGVRGGEIHSHEEFAIPESFVERAQLSALMLCRIASGVIDAPALRALMGR